jgi:hypothetical protein
MDEHDRARRRFPVHQGRYLLARGSLLFVLPIERKRRAPMVAVAFGQQAAALIKVGCCELAHFVAGHFCVILTDKRPGRRRGVNWPY